MAQPVLAEQSALQPDATDLRYAAWLRSRCHLELAAGAVAAVVVAMLLRGHVDTTVLAAWLVLALGIYAGRFAVHRLPRAPAAAPALQRGIATFHVELFAAALAWGSLGLFAAGHLPALNAAVALCVIAAISAFVTVVYGAAWRPTALFILPALLPAGARALANAASGPQVGGAMLLGLAALLLIAAWGTRRFIPETMKLHGEFDAAVADLSAARGQIEKLQVQAKSNAEKRAEAERDLRRTSADLGLLKGKIFALSQTLERVSPLCPVTGIPNRRSFDNALEREWERARRNHQALSLAMCEIDNFEQYCSTYDQQSADALLQRVARVLAQCVHRSVDLVARAGESRFAILWPGADTRNAARLCDEARKRVLEEAIALALPDCGPHATIRAGVATVVPVQGLDAGELLDRVDSALQQASVGGGNTVVQHRALYAYRLERWKPQEDGQYTEGVLINKILHWGFQGRRVQHKPGVNVPDQAVEREFLKAVTGGQLLIVLDGQSLTLRPGDCVIVPEGTTMSLAVVGDRPVTAIDGYRKPE